MNDVFKIISKKSDEHEFFTPIPLGYKIGKTKYIVIFGTVISGLGKGILSSSLGLILQNKGLVVSPMKFDGYLNQDAGTLNPFRHGEVFVLDDGLECDMDLGTYERILHKNLSRDYYLTGGMVFNKIISNERKGIYLGRDVQFIPHVTGEIKLFLRNLALKSNADIVFVEVGGTVGDIENLYFVEAMRQLFYEEGANNVCFIALTYIIKPVFLGEQKSKSAQLGIKNLLSLGIQPHIIGCRSDEPVSVKVREKISMYSNVPFERVFSLHDVRSIYEVPFLLKKEGIDESVIKILDINKKKINVRKEVKEINRWKKYLNNYNNPKSEVSIGIVGKYTGIRDSYASILKALEHAGTFLKCKINVKWVETTDLKRSEISKELKGLNGIIVPGGYGTRGVEGKILCVEYARKNNLPYLGLCYGFQMAVIEFARNVCGLRDANTTEVDSKTKYPVIDILPEQKDVEGLGGTNKLGGRNVLIKKGSKAYELYKKELIRERFRHRFEFNPDYLEVFEEKGMVFSGKDSDVQIMQILELPKHPFFIGTQFHPEFNSRPLVPHPLFTEFVKVAGLKNRKT
ncbi:MAG: CTP synthase (glutamine hydrolyzing) [Nanoarchaeota archaeon]|nr:CTP synthase (glutamine hydrolyzing) [Nanoarchaeota archaeon]